jgi:hypothetical protein
MYAVDNNYIRDTLLGLSVVGVVVVRHNDFSLRVLSRQPVGKDDAWTEGLCTYRKYLIFGGNLYALKHKM